MVVANVMAVALVLLQTVKLFPGMGSTAHLAAAVGQNHGSCQLDMAAACLALSFDRCELTAMLAFL
eukprot:CAMPEP_0197693470 /NCGR_PEP_ID=MMETSP1338-20131121/112545_1 /TAXON_ID=43686 ORGANISM="Pelagodinium beii, Strain RCC1491" /NCGR_SAMPLE_ID=MMETSP1338 /ASSEMBLY_ACC=CAM_ASM_000754 /LENGTH=65 /DNA_ID=CAMNT_0043276219 /DNA_START=137 /DNA_END=331 /DNA_ORIENTATION=+